jgi:hypothetical protein
MRGKEKSDPIGLLYIPFCKRDMSGLATTKRVSSCVLLRSVASLQSRKGRGQVPRCVFSMGIFNKYSQCGVTMRIYVVYPQCVDTMSILIVSTQQVDAYRLVRGGPS